MSYEWTLAQGREPDEAVVSPNDGKEPWLGWEGGSLVVVPKFELEKALGLLGRAREVIRRGEIRLDADCSPSSPLVREIDAALAEKGEPMKLADRPMTENSRGEWVPAIPLPYFFQVLVPYTQCGCGARFYGRHRGRALRRYEEHYALHHILKPARRGGE
jgi:hypothetical protein